MICNIEIPWKRYALIAELATQLEDKCNQFGKTILEKVVYLLQVVYDVDCGYEFSLYNYGPFCSELLSDLDYVNSLGGVTIVAGHWGGYDIKPGLKKDYIISRGIDFINNNIDSIQEVVDNFGTYSAKELELRSTIVYADRDILQTKQPLSKSEFLQLIKQIKSHFSIEQIDDAYSELASNGFVENRL